MRNKDLSFNFQNSISQQKIVLHLICLSMTGKGLLSYHTVNFFGSKSFSLQTFGLVTAGETQVQLVRLSMDLNIPVKHASRHTSASSGKHLNASCN